jgi:hypothetical protein
MSLIPPNPIPSRFYESDFFLWVIFFLYTLSIGASVQWIILPYLFPQFHWGEGLLLGTDSVTYHQIAFDRFNLIRHSGWGNWVLSPLGQTPAGIASFFYVVIAPKPWVMLPINAAFHAGSAFILFKIVSVFEYKEPRWVRWAAVIPFLVFPSAAIIYGQLLKDVYFIFGNMLFIYGWLRWLKQRPNREMVSFREFALCILWFALAYPPVWIVRPYWGPLFFLCALVFFSLITINQVYFFITSERAWKKRGIYWILSLILVLIFGLAIQQNKLPRSMITEVSGHEQLKVELSWQSSTWLPVFIDSRLQSLAFSRKAFVVKYPEAGTNIDTDILFQNAKDIIFYLPRALYVGFFMPSLYMTFQKSINPGGTLMRWITGFEMIFLYLCYPFLLMGGWFWRKRLEFWIFFLWATGGILIYTLVSPNMGALYRFRYGFILSLAALGILKAAMVFPKVKQAAT